MRPRFVGDESAREVVESWYKSISRVKPDIWVLLNIRELECIIHGDAFSVGLDATTVVRELTLKLLTDRVIRKKDDETSESNRTINALLQIKNKANFKLTLRIEQSFLQFNCWPTIFDIFRPMIETFEKEGADVRLLLVYAQDLTPKMEFDMLPALKDPESNWREEAARYFDSDYRVREHHKHYRIENDADYDPESLKDMYYSDDAYQSDDNQEIDWDPGYDGINDDGSTWEIMDGRRPPRSPSPSPARFFGTVFRGDEIEEGF
ncbi:hypothetical protein J4E85_008444 [Alternaria conjuncta]|uniref:uncharacterized protein n=1 Tax=Alternaria conjuncta TaxID=181017 RepID=UPI00222124B9|nr:uncharacterized protein J4E85_008444 [Alternaria conjuncta]KAI4923406.1 hypothetical protein J4E85_008444 [Alternaria conjuncta]